VGPYFHILAIFKSFKKKSATYSIHPRDTIKLLRLKKCNINYIKLIMFIKLSTWWLPQRSDTSIGCCWSDFVGISEATTTATGTWMASLACVTPCITKTLIEFLKPQLRPKAGVNQVTKVWIRIQRQGLEISSFCIVWTEWLSQQFLRIYLKWITSYSQKIICSAWTVLQVCKSRKNSEVIKYLFQGSKQGYSIQFSDLEIPPV
jgi:hypothetical protein